MPIVGLVRSGSSSVVPGSRLKGSPAGEEAAWGTVSDVEVFDVGGVGLDELAAGFDVATHED